MNLPLISVGLVAYNREIKISRAIESVLNQHYPKIELIISNDCSTDQTHDVCIKYAQKDKRIRYFNQRKNLGMTQNFEFVQKQANGEFFMWLSDDDWVEKDYILKCLKFLQENKDYSLVCGKTRFYQNDVLAEKEDVLNIENIKAQDRVLEYFRTVNSNVILYGLMPKEVTNTLFHKNTFGADLLLSAQVVFQGKTRTLEDTYFNYSEGGISNNSEKLAQYYGFTKKQARHPYRVFVKEAFWSILQYSRIYQRLPLLQRMAFALRASFILRERFGQYKWETSVRGRLRLRTRMKNLIKE